MTQTSTVTLNTDRLTGVCFTGHRDLSPDEHNAVMRRLDTLLRILIEKCGSKYFYNGGARGFDTAAAHTVIGLKHRHPEIKLEMYLPCKGQESKWPAKDQAIYRNILRDADHSTTFFPAYTPESMLIRDRAMVDASDLCVAFLRPGKISGGTAYTVRYAKKIGVPVLNLYTVTDEELSSADDIEKILALTER